MENEDHHHHHKELQLLPPPPPPPPPPQPPTWQSQPNLHRRLSKPSTSSSPYNHGDPSFDPGPSLDLQLSISLKPIPPRHQAVEVLRWQAAEQIRLAAMENAYAERVRELTRRELELAHSEFLRARATWDRALDDVARVHRLKESATKQVHAESASSSSSSCMEITCHSCRQRFRL